MSPFTISKIENIKTSLTQHQKFWGSFINFKNWPIFRIDFKKFKIIILILIFLSCILYLTQVNSLATAGFKIKKLEKEISELNKYNQQLELNVIQLQSISRTEALNKNLKMVKLSEVDYIPSSQDSTVAVK